MWGNRQQHYAYTELPNDYMWTQNEKTQTKKRRNRNRRRSKNWEGNTSVASKEHYNEPQNRYFDNYNYRPRAESNVSIGAQSAVSVRSTDSRSRRNSFVGSDYGQWNGPEGQRTLRWDRDRLSREIWNYYQINSQTKDMLTRKNRLKDALHKILSNNFSEYATGLANNRSDVDICIIMNEIDHKSTSDEKKEKESPVSEELVNLRPETTTDVTTEGNKEKGPPLSGPLESVSDRFPSRIPLPNEDKDELKTDTKTETGANVSADDLDQSSDSVGNNSNGNNDTSIPMLQKIEEVLKNYNFVTKMQIILAKVPILKFNDRISGIEVTLNVNKSVSIRNTHLIHDYTKLDWRVQPLLLVIKAWGKDHNINDAYNRSISSYSLVLMVIHYLQYACDPPVLPCLQKLDPNRYDHSVDIVNIRMDSRPKRWKSRNESSLKELLIGFLDYYSYNFCFNKDAISVRLGHTLPKHVVQNYKGNGNSYSHWKFLSIEEPFNRSNTARSVYDQVMFEHILSVLRVSHYTLRRYPFLDSIMTGKQFSNQYMGTNEAETTLPNYDSYLTESSEQKSPLQRLFSGYK